MSELFYSLLIFFNVQTSPVQKNPHPKTPEPAPISKSTDFDDEDDPYKTLTAWQLKNFVYNCNPSYFNDVYVKKKSEETDFEKNMRESKNGQILVCKSAIEHTDNLETIRHFSKIIKKIHRGPSKETVQCLKNLYWYHKGRIRWDKV